MVSDEQKRLDKRVRWSCWLTAALAVLFVACAPPVEKPVCKFSKGDIVQSVLDDRKGQVLRVYSHNCAYSVRFAGNLETQQRSWDVDTIPYAKVHMQEIELKR